MASADNPLSARNLLAGILVTVVGGLILAMIIQDARFAPTATTAATLAPTAPATPEIPPGYQLYDDFTAARDWQDAWWPDDTGKMCNWEASESRLAFRCVNGSQADDAVATLHARTDFDQTIGVAAVVMVAKAGGALELVMNFTCSTDNSRRAYHIAVDMREARATEYFPQPGPVWPMTVLGRTAIEPDREHLLQLERSGDTIDFWVDRQNLALDTRPELPACFGLTDWVIDLYVWKGGSPLEGAIHAVSTR